MTELKKVLKRYKEKTTGVKAALVLCTSTIFCGKNFSKELEDVVDEFSLICYEKEYTYDAVHREYLPLPCTSDLRVTPPINFLEI